MIIDGWQTTPHCLFRKLKKMRQILYLSRGGDIGGSQRQIHYVITNLDRDNYQPIVVCRKDGQFVKQLQDADIPKCILPLHSWRKLRAVLRRYVDVYRLTSFARQHKIDMIHSSDLWLTPYMVRVAERLKIPSILHVRKPIQTREVQKHEFKKATSIIAISSRVQQNLLHAGVPHEKITMINDSVDLEMFKPRSPQDNVLRRDFLPSGQTLIGIVGRIEPLKRQLDFLRAAEQVMRCFTNTVSFFIVGRIRSRQYFERLKKFVSKRGLDKHVFFTGGRYDMPQVLASLDILVSLSGGSVMFEAMACAKTVISAGFSTVQSAVHIQDGRTGLLITSRRNADLAEAITKMVDSAELRTRIGNQARKWAEEKLSCTLMVDQTHRVYDRLIQNSIKTNS